MAFTDSWRIVKQQTRAPNAEVDELHRPGDLLRVLWQFKVQAAYSDGVIIVLEFELAALKKERARFSRHLPVFENRVERNNRRFNLLAKYRAAHRK